MLFIDIFIDHEPTTREGNVFMGVCDSVLGEGKRATIR